MGILASRTSRLTDDLRQPTLFAVRADSPPFSGRWRLFELVALRVIELSRAQASPLTPSHTLTDQVLATGEQCGLIARSAANEPNSSPRVRGVYEDVSWTPLHAGRRHGDAAADLRKYVHDPLNRPLIRGEQLDLWMLLAEAEIDGYVRHLLRHHPLNDQLSRALRLETRVVIRHVSLVTLRRALWTHLRGPESADPEAIGPAAERQWARALAARIVTAALAGHARADNSRFMPSPTQPCPIMRTVFFSEATQLGSRYWTITPSLNALEISHGRAARP